MLSKIKSALKDHKTSEPASQSSSSAPASDLTESNSQAQTSSPAAAPALESRAATTMSAKIAIVYYSSYGHTRSLVEAAAEGIRSTGASVDILKVKETLPEEVQGKMHIDHAKDQYAEVDVNNLPNYDGIIFACPTRYGRVAAQMSQLFDQTGGLWASGKLVGKFASTITSTSSPHGGQESTHLTTYPFFAHHGMIIVPIGYAHKEVANGKVVQGGSAYGASAVAPSDPSMARDINEGEKAIAEYQGQFFAKTVNAYVKGKSASA